MLRDFEQSLKRSFTNSDEDDLPPCSAGGLPDDPEMGIEDGELILEREDMLSIFDPIIEQILPLVQERIDMVEAQDMKKSCISVWCSCPVLDLGLYCSSSNTLLGSNPCWGGWCFQIPFPTAAEGFDQRKWNQQVTT